MTFETRFHKALALRLAEEIETVSSNLLQGHAASMEDYRSHTSRLRALRDVLELCDEVATELAKG